MMGNLRIIVVSGTLVFVYAGLGAAAEPNKAATKTAVDKEATFELREAPAFGLTAQKSPNALSVLRGQLAVCSNEPDKQVKAYPKLESKHPLYGKVKFGANRADPNAGVEYHFVLDESGKKPAESRPGDAKPVGPAAAPAAGKPAGKKSGESSSLLATLAESLSGNATSARSLRPAVAPLATPITYDRLYFDANRDLDLTNDPILLPVKDPPAEFTPFGSHGDQMVTYGDLAIPLDYGPGLGFRSFRLIPRLLLYEFEGKLKGSLCFVATVVRQGQIRIGSRTYDAVLAQPYFISGRFDQPNTAMFLTSVGSSEPPEAWWGAQEIGAMRRVDGKYYTASVTPAGDKLTIKPYRGDMGTFKIGSAKRDLKTLSMIGSLQSETSAVAVGKIDTRVRSDSQPVTECSIPVGDYLPCILTIEYGRLEISVSNNHHSDGHPRDMMERRPLYAVRIRKDKPFVLDFSNKPDVMFASPAKDQSFKPGDEIRVAAVLTDPALGIMIRGLDDTGRKQKEVSKLLGGKESSYERPLSLDPKVTIANSSGKQVAEGKLPFG